MLRIYPSYALAVPCGRAALSMNPSAPSWRVKHVLASKPSLSTYTMVKGIL